MSKIAQLLFSLVLLDIVFGQHPQIATNYEASDHFRQESVDGDGNIKGQYSYIDPNGKTVTVRYTAGKNGFQVEGDQSSVAHGARTRVEPSTPIHEPEYEPQFVQTQRQYALPQHQKLAIKSVVPQVQRVVYAQPQFQAQPQYQAQPRYQVPLEPQSRSYQSTVHIQHTVQPQAPVQYQAAPVTKNLFTPAGYDEPVVSSGQIKNYQDALAEEEKDRQSEQSKSFGVDSQYEEALPAASPVSYVLNNSPQAAGLATHTSYSASVPQITSYSASVPQTSYSASVPTSTQNHYQGPIPVQVDSAYNFELSF